MHRVDWISHLNGSAKQEKPTQGRSIFIQHDSEEHELARYENIRTDSFRYIFSRVSCDGASSFVYVLCFVRMQVTFPWILAYKYARHPSFKIIYLTFVDLKIHAETRPLNTQSAY